MDEDKELENENFAEDKLEQTQEDTFAVAGQSSQVTQHKSKKRDIFWITGVILVLIFIMMFFLGTHKQRTNMQSVNAKNPQDSNLELQANLAKLHNLNESSPIAYESQVANNQQKSSKEYIARRNAPTRIYSVSAQSIQNTPKQTSQVKEATLSDNSIDAKFANSKSQVSTMDAIQIPHPAYTIVSGEFIHAVLESAINSDLPGKVRAVISQPVYGYIGERPLIPAGSRLIGQYSSAILQGQNRVMIIWQRIILPNGVSINVDSPGVDELGRAGQGADSINTHFFTRFGEAVLLSILSAGAANVGVNSQDQYNASQQYRMAIAQSFAQSASQSLENTLPRKPTLHIYQGAQINVFVARDLSFYNVFNVLRLGNNA